MRLPRFWGRAEARSVEDPRIPVSVRDFWQRFVGDIFGMSVTGEPVTIETALGVPAIWAAVNFMSGELASLPLHLHRGQEKVSGGLATILRDAANDDTTSFDWRKYTFDQVFTGGRGFTFIERNGASKVMNLWPLDPAGMTVKRDGGRKIYEYRDGATRTVSYKAEEVIDVPFMLKGDMLCHRSPIMSNSEVIGMAIAATKYAARFFGNGGVPPLQLVGPLTTAAGVRGAGEALTEGLKAAKKENRPVLPMPAGHELKPIGVDPQKSQLIELQRFVIEQVARIYSLPPTFLQDLTHGTFSNTEQQDLHFVKHTLTRWVQQFEQQLNLKLFGRSSRQFVKMNVDGLLRGDFKTRMDGYGTAIQNGILEPDEARELEDRPARGGPAAKLYIQGATVPLGSQPVAPAKPAGGDQNAA